MKNTLSRFSLILLTGALGFSACGADAERVSFDKVCDMHDQAWVTMDGFLHYPTTEQPVDGSANVGAYRMLFVEKQNGTGGFLLALIDHSESPQPNMMMALPVSYTYDNFRVYADDNSPVSANDRVRLTGQILKDEDVCLLQIKKIEKP